MAGSAHSVSCCHRFPLVPNNRCRFATKQNGMLGGALPNAAAVVPERGSYAEQLVFQQKSQKTNKELAAQQRAYRNGRGLGQDDQFQPFIQVTRSDFSSHGRSEIVSDPIIGRLHHFLSRLEYFIWLILLHLGASQVREQFPLGVLDNDADFPDRNWEGLGTLAAAGVLNIAHPMIAAEHPRVQSTDLLVSDTRIDRAVFIRYDKDVPRRGRQLQLLNLHTLYWRERGVQHYVLTEKDVDYALVDLLIWSYISRRTHPTGGSQDFLVFLRTCSTSLSLRGELEKWRGPEFLVDAVTEFKAGVFTGQIAVTTKGVGLRPLNRPWDFRVVEDAHRSSRLQRFFAEKEAQRV